MILTKILIIANIILLLSSTIAATVLSHYLKKRKRNQEALKILTEMQKWRRAQHPYDYDGDNPTKYRGIPYTPEQFGKAIDVAIKALQ